MPRFDGIVFPSHSVIADVLHLGLHVATAPDDDKIATGAKYCCVIDVENRSRTGKVFNEDREVKWSYGPSPNPLGYSLRNPLNKPDFVVSDPDGQRMVSIRRVSFIPSRSRFHILEGDQVVGHINLSSVFLNKYVFKISGLAPCIFRMPLFTRCFYGKCNHDTCIWVVVGPGTRQWNLLIQPEMANVRLLSAIAFVHNQWNNYN